VALQADNYIVAVGFTNVSSESSDFALARYRPDGNMLDSLFSEDGKLITDFGGSDQGHAVAIQPDGKIVVAGFSNASGDNDFALARYNPGGSLDTGPSEFATDGTTTTDFSDLTFAGSNDFGNDVALQPDGKIVVAGTAGGDFALARYNANGTLDTSFLGDGRQTAVFFDQPQSSFANGVAVQPDGKIVVAGTAGAQGSDGVDFALARYNPDGTLDTTFSGDGKQTETFGGSDVATGLVLQPDGKIVLAGYSLGDFAIARFQGGGGSSPPPDGDGDGVPDAGDACPTVAGSTANGCPPSSSSPLPPGTPSPIPVPPGPARPRAHPETMS